MYTSCDETYLQTNGPAAAKIERSWAVRHSHQAVAVARRDVKSMLESCGVGRDTVDSVTLVVSELTTNSITHALPPVTLRVAVLGQGVIRIEVVDAGTSPDVCRPANQPTDEHGRGNLIVSTLTSGTGQLAYFGRVTRWAEVPVG
ncbi:ATP-binding protein [Streptomyces chartreusis]|uniref:ATP-binding protein n=1 Tax=Streptomyces chartreusis TaxID=1969 RepID=UPI002F91BBFD|nr:ATP-binding protein [Streptomyces chartreusis]WTA33515.1 ATP-binding protein [Streptomyces chartreusis]